jgi:hypothetical protein
MEFLKANGYILLGGVPKDKQPEYFTTLCCEVESTDKKHQFRDICVTRKQLKMLRDMIDQHLGFADEDESEVISADRQLLQKMEALVQIATNGAVSFDDIWDSFWEIKTQIDTYVDYYDPDTTSEADIMAYLEAARNQIK